MLTIDVDPELQVKAVHRAITEVRVQANDTVAPYSMAQWINTVVVEWTTKWNIPLVWFDGTLYTDITLQWKKMKV